MEFIAFREELREIASILGIDKSTVCNYLASEAQARAREFAMQRSALIAQSIAVFRNQQRILMERVRLVSPNDHVGAKARPGAKFVSVRAFEISEVQ